MRRDALSPKISTTFPTATTVTIPSPCINVCVMDEATGWCTGCLRTLDEIIAWGVADHVTKQAVLSDLPQREAVFFNQLK